MIVGTIKEIKTHEYRVGLTPDCVRAYVENGHSVYVESGAGVSIGFSDDHYRVVGAKLMPTAKDVFDHADMIVKVKEPQKSEYQYFRNEQILYTYLHLAADKELSEMLMDKKVNAVAYETIEDENGMLPCLKPMSEIAGRLSVQQGAKYLEKTYGGKGVLLAGVPGVRKGKVAILGGGVVGASACKIAVGMGADVTVLDLNANRMSYLEDVFGSRISLLYSTESNIETICKESDLIIGAVLVPGAKAPNLIKRKHLEMMQPGSVLVDVAIDQGGCFETSKPTTHDDPIYIVDDIVHYSVANMPGAVALTSTLALTSVTLSYGLEIANLGLENSCFKNPNLAKGVNIYKGNCVYEAVAKAHSFKFTPANFTTKE